MSTPPDRPNKRHQTTAPSVTEPLQTEPLSPVDARRAEEGARQRPLTVNQDVIENRRRGRIEVETKRISEEMTRQAQERIRASQAANAPANANAAVSPHVMPTSSQGKTAMLSPQIALPIPTAIKRIVVPLDGSVYSERALPYIAPVARITGADVTLVHVILAPIAHALDAVSRSVLPDASAARLTDPTGYLAEIEARLAQQGIAAESMCVSAQSAVEGVELVMQRLDASLVILATHAQYGLQQQILGSVGDRLVQQGQIPVLLIPPRVDIHTPPLNAFSRVLVPLDGSVLAEQAIAPVMSLAPHTATREEVQLHIVLLYVADNHISRPDGVRYVEGVKERMLAQGFPAPVEVTSAAVVGSPPGAIVGAAEHGIINLPYYPAPFDLVAMATHGRGGLQRWLYGSVAAYVLPRIKTPVLLVHPHTSAMYDDM